MIGIINYGLGNIRAFLNAYEAMGIDVCIIEKDFNQFSAISGLILPGVGSFDDAIRKLRRLPCFSDIMTSINNGTPVMGVCVGMQILFNSSEEGAEEGLGLVQGHVRQLPRNSGLRSPHMGPNLMHFNKNHLILNGIAIPEFYFLHSYYCDPISDDAVIGYTNYGIKFPSMIHNQNIYGVQFHPEKSHGPGGTILKNFALICEEKTL